MLKKSCLGGLLVFILNPFLGIGQDKAAWKIQPVAIQTRWAKDVNPEKPLPEYPRPQMVRDNWQNLNGLWDYTITPKEAAMPSTYQGKILVPYPLESALSGVKKSLQPSENLWYRRTFHRPALKAGEHILLHFGAVDWQATVYVNGKETGTHAGGYQSFTQDITAAFKTGENEIVVKVFDPTNHGIGPHGKQVLNPENIYYTPSSGIWQTVWLETVPADYITSLVMTPDVDNGILKVNVKAPEGTTVELIATHDGATISTEKGGAGSLLNLAVKNAKLWSPETPFLYGLIVRLTKEGKILDEVKSYFGMRKIAVQKDEKGVDRIFLNNKPYFNLGTLDQGFWPDGLYTAPTDKALEFDIAAIKAMGFNTIRKHIKVESARWYYYADKLGMLVWQDIVNPNQRLPEGAKVQYEKETEETLKQLHNTPSITTWVIFNEKWGAYDQQRITEWVKASDSSRIVNGHSGEMLYVDEQLRSPSPNAWVSADLTDVHSYPDPMNAPGQPGKARVLGEFGGIGVFIPEHQWLNNAWGYVNVQPASLVTKYLIMNQHLQILRTQGLSASIYTQPFDVEGEQNGLITYDREIIKIPLIELREIHKRLNPQMGVVPNVIVKDADITDVKISYSRLLDQYINGNRDQDFLQKLIISAVQNDDITGSRLLMRAYIADIKQPYRASDLHFIFQITKSVKDPGFSFIQNNAAQIDSIIGKNAAEVKIMGVIGSSVVDPLSKNKVNPDWDDIEKTVTGQYGHLGEEIVWIKRIEFYVETNDWNNLGKYYKLYYDKILPLKRSLVNINNVSWLIFEHVIDTSILKTAVKASRFNLDHYEGSDSDAIDTYANLLYKIGEKQEALTWEKKALQLSNNREDIMANYNKMKSGQPTWR